MSHSVVLFMPLLIIQLNEDGIDLNADVDYSALHIKANNQCRHLTLQIGSVPHGTLFPTSKVVHKRRN